MKSLLATAAAISFLIAGAASAADVAKPAVTPAPGATQSDTVKKDGPTAAKPTETKPGAAVTQPGVKPAAQPTDGKQSNVVKPVSGAQVAQGAPTVKPIEAGKTDDAKGKPAAAGTGTGTGGTAPAVTPAPSTTR